MCFHFFFFNDTATTEIYTLSLHDALPIWVASAVGVVLGGDAGQHPLQLAGFNAVLLGVGGHDHREHRDRKSTRLNSSHLVISYAVFCLKKKKKMDFWVQYAHHR